MALPGELLVVDDVPTAFTERTIASFQHRQLDSFSIALSGGSTARACYEHLAANVGTQIDWWKVDVYWGDERCVPHDHEDSNYLLAREALLDRVGVANATHLMRCAEVDAYQLRIGDLGRFDNPRKLMSYLGLVPSENTTSTRRRQGGITKTGNSHARWMIVESANAHEKKEMVSPVLSKRQEGQSHDVKALSWRAQTRLCYRRRRLSARKLPRNKVTVAIARELCAFIWELDAIVRREQAAKKKAIPRNAPV